MSGTLLDDIANDDEAQLEMGNHDSRRERKGGGGGGMIYDGHAEMHYDLESEETLFKHT